MSGDGNPTIGAREKALKEARAAGHVVVYGDQHTLQLDLDSKADEEKALDMLERFADKLGVRNVQRSESKSGHAHFYVHLHEAKGRAERIFWQAALGSDRTREALNWLWMQGGHEEECFLVEVEFYELTEVWL